MAIPCPASGCSVYGDTARNARGAQIDTKFGFTVMADIDAVGFFSLAEALGYDSV
jgi:hypothetical protein